MFCCIGREQSHGAFEDLAQIFAPQFQGVDLVGTDIAVGLMLVAQQQTIAVEKQKLLRDGCSLAEIQCQRFDTSIRVSMVYVCNMCVNNMILILC